jgi:hypothetical protein
MGSIKRQIILVLIYLVVVFSLERLDVGTPGMLNLHPFAYILIGLAMVVTVLIPQLRRASIYILIPLWGGIYLAVWALVVGELSSFTPDKLQVAIIEFILIMAGVMLAHGLARQLTQVEDTIENLAFGEIPGRATFLEDASEAIKVELTRSRRYNHPLTVLVLEPDPDSLQTSLQRTLHEIKLNIAQRYATARLCQIINEAARRTDPVLQQSKKGRFVILCPETEPHASTILANRIQSLAHDNLGIAISWGAAAFPEEAVTFDELLRKAELNLLSPAAHTFPSPTESAGAIADQGKS